MAPAAARPGCYGLHRQHLLAVHCPQLWWHGEGHGEGHGVPQTGLQGRMRSPAAAQPQPAPPALFLLRVLEGREPARCFLPSPGLSVVWGSAAKPRYHGTGSLGES